MPQLIPDMPQVSPLYAPSEPQKIMPWVTPNLCPMWAPRRQGSMGRTSSVCKSIQQHPPVSCSAVVSSKKKSNTTRAHWSRTPCFFSRSFPLMILQILSINRDLDKLLARGNERFPRIKPWRNDIGVEHLRPHLFSPRVQVLVEAQSREIELTDGQAMKYHRIAAASWLTFSVIYIYIVV